MTMDDAIKIAFANSIKFIDDITGSCPADHFNYKKIDCENECSKRQPSDCWKEYFMKGGVKQCIKQDCKRY